MIIPKLYLGDSVYAEWDGEHIVLSTQNDDRGPSNTIYMHQDVVDNLLDYVQHVRGEQGQPDG